MSYLREKSNQNVRYSKTTYLYTVQTFSIAVSAILAGVLKNKLKFSIKTMAIAGSLFLR